MRNLTLIVELATLQHVANDALDVCHMQGWSREWPEAGCYLHLECSEFIEALRGKGTSTPVEEAGDVLFVLLSTLAANEIPVEDVLRSLQTKIKKCQVRQE